MIKARLLVTLLIVFSLSSSAQTWKELSDSLIYYYQRKDYTHAIPVGVKAATATREKFGAEHPVYASYLSLLGGIYYLTSQFNPAIPLFIESMGIYGIVHGESHKDYIQSVNQLAASYQMAGQAYNAAPLFLKLLKINKKLTGEESPDYAGSLNRLAKVYEELGQYSDAEKMMLDAVRIRLKVLGEKHLDYATSLNNLGMIYKSMGRWDKAERMIQQAMMIRKELTGDKTTEYANSLNNLAMIYELMGQYSKSEPYYLQSLEIFKKEYGARSTHYATNLNNLGQLYQSMGRYTEAEQLLIQSMTISGEVVGVEHPTYLSTANNLAGIYLLTGNYSKAEELYLKARVTEKKVLGEKHPEYIKTMNDVAYLYKKMERYDESLELYKETLALNKAVIGENHPDYASTLENLAALYTSTGKYKEAEPLISESNRISMRNLIDLSGILSENEKSTYLSGQTLTDTWNSLVYYYPGISPEAFKENFQMQLLLKGFSLSDTKNMFESIRNSSDSGMRILFSAWQTNKQQLSKEYSLPMDARRGDIKNLAEETEQQEKELNTRSSVFRSSQKKSQTRITDIQQQLRADEVAIEFVSFMLYRKNWSDSTMYAAYIIRKDTDLPLFVPLCEEKQLGQFFQPSGGSTLIKTIYRSEVIDEDSKPAISGDSLYSLVWKPLLPYLSGINKISYAPSGLLSRIAFNALPAGNNQLLIDKFDLKQYTSIQQIAIAPDPSTSAASITMFGNCSFSADSAALVKKTGLNDKTSTVYSPATGAYSNRGSWATLPGTATELNKIQNLFSKNKKAATSFTGVSATEEQFKSLSTNAPAIIHVATHGFFLPDPGNRIEQGLKVDKRNAFTLADDPMLRSGLVLSGANRVWGGKPPIAGMEDGILTSYEISQLDLRRTELVVLSACETALGDIRGTEGVFGLQRAFKLAGAKNMILSLWKVPDAETAELMKAFYQYYINGQPIRAAFNNAQKEMRKKYAPYFWAAFVLIE